MTVRIVDRRQDSRNKSSVNRSRFIRRFKGQIRKAMDDAIAKRGIQDLSSGEKIGISNEDISEPQFHHGKGGVRDVVHPGNDRFARGDEVERPEDGGGQGSGKGEASKDGEGLDDFVFTLSRDEFFDLFFDDLELPNLVRRQLAQIEDFKRIRAGYTQSGMPTNINLVRTMRGAAGRRIAIGGPHNNKIKQLQDELQCLEELEALEKKAETAYLESIQSEDSLSSSEAFSASPVFPVFSPQNPAPFHDPSSFHAINRQSNQVEIERLRHEISTLKVRREAIPFIDPIDLRYANHIRVPTPSTKAVMFCLMDVSGSMDEAKKQMGKRFFMLLYLFLNRNYEHIEVVFLRHHTSAEEVDEDGFFHSRETGGTIVSSVLELMQSIIAQRYNHSLWNIYAAQASDGDNWSGDSPLCTEILKTGILPFVQYFAYVEITDGDPQNLWEEYSKLSGEYSGHFAMQHITQPADIYPVFRELFRKRLV